MTTNPLPLPPGRRGLPLLGETLSFLRSPLAFNQERRARFGDVFRTHLFGAPTVFLAGADANRWIFAGENDYLQNRWAAPVRRLLGPRSLSMIAGEEHRERRKVLAPHFTRASMERTIPMIERLTREHLARWPQEGEVVLVPRLKALAFEIATTFLVGPLPPATLESLERDFDVWVEGLFVPLPYAFPGTKLARALAAHERMMTLLDRLVRDRDGAASTGTDVLSTLLAARDDEGRPLDRDTIAQEIQLLFFAGHDTTVTSTTNAMIHLALHPEALARAREEQDALGAGPIDAERVARAEWLTAVVRESMRVIPPIGGAFRVATRDVEYGGHRIPEGWVVLVGAAGTHFDERLFPDPNRFDPERMLEPRAEHKKTPFAWIPFGGGPRLCLGQHFAMLEMQAMLALLVRDHAWELVDRERLAWTSIPFPRPRDGGRVRFRRRYAH